MKKELYKTTMTYGLYVGLAITTISFVFHLFGSLDIPGSKSGLLNTMVMIFFMMYFGRKYQKENFPNGMTYGQAYGFIALLSVFTSVIYTFYIYIYYSIIAPQAISIYLEQVEQAINEMLQTSEGQAETLIAFYQEAVTAGVMSFSMGFKQIISGLFMGLIVSFFIKTPLNLRTK